MLYCRLTNWWAAEMRDHAQYSNRHVYKIRKPLAYVSGNSSGLYWVDLASMRILPITGLHRICGSCKSSED